MSVTYVVGAGAIGCTVGYSLQASGRDVTYVEADRAKIEWGRRHGVKVDWDHYEEEDFVIPVLPAKLIHFDDWQPESTDDIFLCVKCFNNAEVLQKVPEGAVLIPVQNGYDPILEKRNISYEGIAAFVARCEPSETNIKCTRDGRLYFGSRESNNPFFTYAPWFRIGFGITVVPDIRPIKATKLLYNAAISPLAAASGIDNGELLTDPLARNLFFDLLKENYSILTAANVPLGKVGPFHPHTVMKILRTPWLARLLSKYFVRSLRGTYCSMAGDIEKGRTELDNYTGHLLRLAGDSIPAPLNRAVYDVVSQLRAPDRAILKKIR